MKIHVLSDLHLESNEIYNIQADDADIIVLAGDIGLFLEPFKWVRSQTDKPVIYVAGNHEFYGTDHPRHLTKLRIEAKKYNITFLENDFVDIDDIRFIGATLWAEVPNQQDHVYSHNISDYHVIKNNGASFTVDYMQSLYRETYEFLKKSFSTIHKNCIITHNAPLIQCQAPQFKNSILSPYFCNNMLNFIMEYQPDFWIYGHTHFNINRVIYDTHIMSNQYGYNQGKEIPDFNPHFILDTNK